MSAHPPLTRRERLAVALQTAAEWHSDREGGINLLRLSSCRKVHSEEHRAGLVAEIKADMSYCIARSDLDEIRRLLDLWRFVKDARVGDEWLSDRENLRLNDRLYEEGVIGRPSPNPEEIP